jgi:hypothetical protein
MLTGYQIKTLTGSGIQNLVVSVIHIVVYLWLPKSIYQLQMPDILF